ncbi:MAG: hypothetical protein WC867_04675 [Candidatus Pacearchaeota archaeon]|jgi:hypothetical protein
MDLKKDGNLEPYITEKRIWNQNHIFLSLIISFIFIFMFFIILYVFKLELTTAILTAALFIVSYAIILFFLLEPKILKEINHPIIKTIKEPGLSTQFIIEKPIYKIIEKDPVIIEKPVQLMHETEKRIYITNPIEKKKKEYNFIGSSLTFIYHNKDCRLGKSIKDRYKISNDLESFFKSNKYRPCKVCITKEKKV